MALPQNGRHGVMRHEIVKYSCAYLIDIRPSLVDEKDAEIIMF